MRDDDFDSMWKKAKDLQEKIRQVPPPPVTPKQKQEYAEWLNRLRQHLKDYLEEAEHLEENEEDDE